MNPISKDLLDLIKLNPKDFKQDTLSLCKEMVKNDCQFGDEIVPHFLRPIFLHSSQASELSVILKKLMVILEKTALLYFKYPDLNSHFCINGLSKELVAIDHGYKRNVVIARPDSFYVDSVPRFVEFNCDSPAGPGYCDVEEQLFLKTKTLKSLERKYHFIKKNRCEHLLQSLIDTYQEFSGSNKQPTIAIVDWKEVKTINEFRIIQSHFIKRGFETIIADPRELKLKSGKLEAKGIPIDLIYKRVIFRELVKKHDDVKDFISACKKGVICVANPLRARIASHKAFLAIMTDLKNFGSNFTDEENALIEKHFPWTRCVNDTESDYKGNSIQLKKFIIENQSNLVLKQSDSYGGKDVIVGDACNKDDWQNLLSRILSEHENWVVQEKIVITNAQVPYFKDDKVLFKTKKYNFNPFVFSGNYSGSMARLSDQAVINVTAGGGMVPVIEYEDKK